MHVRSHLKDLPLPWVTKKIMFHFPAATYEPSKDPGITNPSIVNITFTMLSETLSILQIFRLQRQTLLRKTLPRIFLDNFFFIIHGCFFKYVNLSQSFNTQKINFSIKGFLRIWSHTLKKSLMENLRCLLCR